jgi:cardiolipin synthase (CMP-forming)
VSRLAKWKTGIQMTSIGFLLVGDAGPSILPVQDIGEALLWVAALLTLVTGYDYLRAGLPHMTDERPRRRLRRLRGMKQAKPDTL